MSTRSTNPPSSATINHVDHKDIVEQLAYIRADISRLLATLTTPSPTPAVTADQLLNILTLITATADQLPNPFPSRLFNQTLNQQLPAGWKLGPRKQSLLLKDLGYRWHKTPRCNVWYKPSPLP